MATTYSTETANAGLTPPKKIADVGQRGRVMVLKNSIALASQAKSSNIFLGNIPVGSRFKGGVIVTDTSLGSAKVSVGTAADNVAFLASGTFTSTETPTAFGKVAARVATAYTADTAVYLYNDGTAALPASGNLVIDIEYITS